MDHLLMVLLLLWSSGLQAEGDHISTGRHCPITDKADIMLLVDGSSSISHRDFYSIKSFVTNLVSKFDTGPDRVQIGLTQYSTNPKTEWHLNTHQTKQSLLEAINSLRQQYGDTFTGRALKHILRNNFNSNMGMRADSQKIAVLITDGLSKDNVIRPARRLKDAGIEIFTIGVGNANEDELKPIASDPKEVHMYYVSDFMFLQDLVINFNISHCTNTTGDVAGSQCQTRNKADIVFLMDDSSSISPSNFITIKSIVTHIVSAFDIGPDRVQIGLTRYSDIPKTEWNLNTHQTKQSLLKAIAKLEQKGGNTMTALALKHVLHKNFKPNVGMRADSQKIAVMITDGESTDIYNINRIPQDLKDTGIEMYTIGLQDAAKHELEIIASDPKKIHMYYVNNYYLPPNIINSLIINLCKSTNSLDSVRLVNGTSLCSGRLEVKSDQSNQWWSSVCEADFDQQDAKVVCSELGCGAPSVPQGALYGEGEAPMWTRGFQCGGNESALLDCKSSDLARTCSSGKAVGLTCSEPVRLLGGDSHCAGRLEVKYRGKWRPVDGSDWTMKEAAVACRDLNCGSAVSTRSRNETSVTSVWVINSGCVESGYVRECASSGSSSSTLEITCLDSVRLVNGTSLCSGRLEVKSDQSNQWWSSVCEADFDQQDAEVVCSELGCGAPSVLQGALYGEGEAPMWTKEFQCGGHESALLDCRTSDSARTCSSGQAVGLTCSEPVRLLGGDSRCAGELEVKYEGQWRPVHGSDWTLKEVAVACRELNCGSAVIKEHINKSQSRSVWKIKPDCVESGSAVRECATLFLSSSTLNLVCSDLLFQPIISMFSMHEMQHQNYASVLEGSYFTISCATKPQYPGGSFQLTFTSSNTTHKFLQPAVNHSAQFLFPAAEPTHQGNYTCAYQVNVFSHNFSSESRLLSLSVSDPTVFIIRLVVLLLSLLSFATAICYVHKTT